jgi:hypothetical protein
MCVGVCACWPTCCMTANVQTNTMCKKHQKHQAYQHQQGARFWAESSDLEALDQERSEAGRQQGSANWTQ